VIYLPEDVEYTIVSRNDAGVTKKNSISRESLSYRFQGAAQLKLNSSWFITKTTVLNINQIILYCAL